MYRILVLIVLVFIFQEVTSRNTVEFKGINRTGFYSETYLLKKWPDSGPELMQIDGLGKGFYQPIVTENTLYLLEEKNGNLALVNSNSQNMEVISSFRISGGIGPYCWAHPAIYYGKLYIRHGEVLLLYNIRNYES